MAEQTGPGGYAERLGAEVTTADDGSARIGFEAREEHLNPAGTLHGGVLATLVDTAMGQAVRTTTGEGEVPATSQLTVTYLRPGRPGPLTVTARGGAPGADLTHSEGAHDNDGRARAPPGASV
ncbi:PaaI family thioesterase, partial [Geodermatophilus sp. SYSU D00079]